MEWAISISKSSEFKDFPARYSRIYFGNEFCQKLIPSIEEIEKALIFASSKSLNFTFVTSYVTDDGVDRLRILLRIISQKNPGSEVVVNDWGMLDIVKGYGLKPVIGRLLIKQKRDPRISNLIGKWPKLVAEYSKYASVDFYLSKFLKSKGVERIEIDNLLQGIELEKTKTSGLFFSLYFPYGYIATSRRCFFDNDNQIDDKDSWSGCQNSCDAKFVSLQHAALPAPLYVKGNTVFFRNRKFPPCVKRKEIDRLVILSYKIKGGL